MITQEELRKLIEKIESIRDDANLLYGKQESITELVGGGSPERKVVGNTVVALTDVLRPLWAIAPHPAIVALLRKERVHKLT